MGFHNLFGKNSFSKWSTVYKQDINRYQESGLQLYVQGKQLQAVLATTDSHSYLSHALRQSSLTYQQSWGNRMSVTLSVSTLNFRDLPQTSSSGGLADIELQLRVDHSKILLSLPCYVSNSWQQSKNLQCCNSMVNEWLIPQVTDEECQGLASVVLQQRSGHCLNFWSCWYLGHSPLAAV